MFWFVFLIHCFLLLFLWRLFSYDYRSFFLSISRLLALPGFLGLWLVLWQLLVPARLLRLVLLAGNEAWSVTWSVGRSGPGNEARSVARSVGRRRQGSAAHLFPFPELWLESLAQVLARVGVVGLRRIVAEVIGGETQRGVGPRLGGKRVMQRRFNVSVPRARVPGKASTLRGRSKGRSPVQESAKTSGKRPS